MSKKSKVTKKPTKIVKRPKKLPKNTSKQPSAAQMKLWNSIGKKMEALEEKPIPHASPPRSVGTIAAEEKEILGTDSVDFDKIYDINPSCLTPSINRWLLEYNDSITNNAPPIDCRYSEILGVAEVFGVPTSNMKKFLEFSIRAQSFDIDSVKKLNSLLKKTIYALREFKLKQATKSAEAMLKIEVNERMGTLNKQVIKSVPVELPVILDRRGPSPNP